jgi:hypothetical protein
MGERTDRAAHRFLLVSVWISATMIAGVVTWTAMANLGQDAAANNQTTLSQSDVRRELSALPSSTPPGRPPSTGPTTTVSTTPQHPTSPPSHQQPRHSRSWTVPEGHLGASCRGAVIRVDYATPADGWGMRMNDSRPDKVTVEFSRGDSDFTLEASCHGGVPVLKSGD